MNPFAFVYQNLNLFFKTALVKAKQYDWKDTNLALFGTDTDRQVKSKCRTQKL